MGPRAYIEVTPSASRLTGSLRDIGYDFPAAVADIVDNSVAAGASEVAIEIEFDGIDSTVTIADNGSGMSPNGINESLRFGSRRDYRSGDLGRYGLGLKTASLSQCRVLTVASRRSGTTRTSVRQLDLDLIEEWDEWSIIDPGSSKIAQRARGLIKQGMSTVVIWDYLDRALPERNTEGGWAKRRIESLTAKAITHLSMVFHRFLEFGNSVPDVAIMVNGTKLTAWDPFASDETASQELGPQTFELSQEGVRGTVRLRRFVLPARDRFSSPSEWERLAGPLKWNRQQGIYVYRADRLVQWGGWCGIRAIDEHTKLGRAALEFDTDLDPIFNINVAKMRVSLPPQLRQMLERPINELCISADSAYRGSATRGRRAEPVARKGPEDGYEPPVSNAKDAQPAGPAARQDLLVTASLALRSAAVQTGELAALRRMAEVLRQQAPDVALALGLNGL